MKNMTICLMQQLLQRNIAENGENKMTNTTTTTEELVLKTMIAELKIMNLKLDLLENEIDQKLNK